MRKLAEFFTRAHQWVRGGGPRRALAAAALRCLRLLVAIWRGFVQWLVWILNLRFADALKVFVSAALAVGILTAIALFLVVNYPATQIPEHDPVDQIVFLDQGWGDSQQSPKRQEYYYTPQGTSLRQLRYSWFADLEIAWGRERFASAENMRALGFLVDYNPTPANPDILPVGFTRHFDPTLGEDVLDLTCAACHSGELDLTTKDNKRVGIRIDGGPAMHAFTAMKVGQFGPTLLAAMAATWLNPLKFDRFARKVLGNSYPNGEWSLFRNFGAVMLALAKDGYHEYSRNLYPVEEGFGRTDAIGRISNRVFADDMQNPDNYRQSNAPVSYPAIWDIWKFDWVQYTASVSQPMVRNLTESLGVGADLHLVNPYGGPIPAGERYTSSGMVENLYKIENLLHDLKAPVWPEQILGPIDRKKAAAGQALYDKYCAHCHQPCEETPEDRAVDVPGKKPDQPEWRVNAIPVEDIGTDPASALHFVNTRVDLSKTGMTAGEIRPFLKDMYDEQQARDNAYRKRMNMPPQDNRCETDQALDSVNLTSVSIGAGLSYIGILLRNRYYTDHDFTPEQRAEYNGFGALDLPRVELVYKARPLAGVWATAPYLHNGSVATLYEMLIPADKRRKKFFVGRREFDPVQVGLYAQPLSKNGFWLDTTIPGNSNAGHEFRAGYHEWHPGDPPSHGIIGPELTEDERWAIIEYLKIRTDDDAPPCKPLPAAPPPPACQTPGSKK